MQKRELEVEIEKKEGIEKETEIKRGRESFSLKEAKGKEENW